MKLSKEAAGSVFWLTKLLRCGNFFPQVFWCARRSSQIDTSQDARGCSNLTGAASRTGPTASMIHASGSLAVSSMLGAGRPHTPTLSTMNLPRTATSTTVGVMPGNGGIAAQLSRVGSRVHLAAATGEVVRYLRTSCCCLPEWGTDTGTNTMGHAITAVGFAKCLRNMLRLGWLLASMHVFAFAVQWSLTMLAAPALEGQRRCTSPPVGHAVGCMACAAGSNPGAGLAAAGAPPATPVRPGSSSRAPGGSTADASAVGPAPSVAGGYAGRGPPSEYARCGNSTQGGRIANGYGHKRGPGHLLAMSLSSHHTQLHAYVCKTNPIAQLHRLGMPQCQPMKMA
jgi:hypothetical protein